MYYLLLFILIESTKKTKALIGVFVFPFFYFFLLFPSI